MTALEHLELTLLGLMVIAGASIIVSTLRLGISPMPTSPRVRARLLAMTPPVRGEVHELGCGWGGLAWALAKQLPEAQIIAWEASPVPYLFCRLRSLVQPRANLTLRYEDLHTADLRRASLIVCYLFTGAMRALAAKFEAELPPGAYVLTHTFAWPGREPELLERAGDLYRTCVYRYRINAPGR